MPPMTYRITTVWLYCVIVSLIFVLNLYLLVPPHVRRFLPRNHPTHIRWRLLSVVISSFLAIAIQPYLLGRSYFLLLLRVSSSTSSSSILVGAVSPAIFHIWILYAGPILLACWNTHSSFRPPKNMNDINQTDSHVSYRTIIHRAAYTTKAYVYYWISTLYTQSILPFTLQPWVGIRDLIIAPLAEEVVFRVCIVPPFLHMLLCGHNYHHENHPPGHIVPATTAAVETTPTTIIITIQQQYPSIVRQVCFMTPLLFGFAHIHHAILKYNQYRSTTARITNRPMLNSPMIQRIILETLFQFTYTSLFGAYTCYVYCCTASLWDIVLIHSFCNYMGLPNISWFFYKNNTFTCGTSDDDDDAIHDENVIDFNTNQKLYHSSLLSKLLYIIPTKKMIVGCTFLLGIVGFFMVFFICCHHPFSDRLFPETYTLLQFLDDNLSCI